MCDRSKWHLHAVVHKLNWPSVVSVAFAVANGQYCSLVVLYLEFI